MCKKTTVWLIIAASLILVGCSVFGGVMAMLNWDFTKLSTVTYETNKHEIHTDFKDISVVTDTANVLFLPSENAETAVVCHESKNATHSVTVIEETLTIKITDTRKWYEHIGINFGTPKITVYLPEGEYETLSVTVSTGNVEIPENFNFKNIDISGSTGDIASYASSSETMKIKTSTGDIRVENLSANDVFLSVSTGKVIVSSLTCRGNLRINVSTGKTSLIDITCQNLVSDGTTGRISLKNVIAKESFSIERSTGDVTFDRCDAAEINVKVSTGDVKGSLRTEKAFIAQTGTGRVDVPYGSTGGKCQISTGTGDIVISIEQ